MLDVYSFALAAGFAAAGLGLAAALIAGATSARAAGLDRLAFAASLAALALVLISSVVHYSAGHAPESEAPLTPIGFLAGHPAFAAMALLAASTLLMTRHALDRRSGSRRRSSSSASRSDTRIGEIERGRPLWPIPLRW